MAQRGSVHFREAKKFKNWLTQHGWTVEESTAQFEVVRARKGGNVLIGYKRLRSDHLSFADKYWPIIAAYERSKPHSRAQF